MRFLAVTISLSATLAINLRAQQRACELARKPKQLPTVGALVDSAGASAGLAAIDAPDGMVFSLALREGDSVPLVRPLFGTDSAAAAILARWIRPQQRTDEPWAVRLRAAHGPDLSLRVERAMSCPPVFIPPAQAPMVVLAMPDERLALNENGRFIVTTLVSEAGLPVRLRIVGSSGVPDLDKALEQTWRQAQYQPALLDGLPVRAWYRSDQPPEPPELPPAEDDSVYLESTVDSRPEIVPTSHLVYPDVLRQAGIQGRVVVQAIIDKKGRVEPRSVQVIETANDGFDQSVTKFVRDAKFRPGSIHGRAVRVRVNLPIEFKIGR